jgi:hypothetical protein
MPEFPSTNRLTMKYLDDAQEVIISWVENLIQELKAQGINVSDLPSLSNVPIAVAKKSTSAKLVDLKEDAEIVDLDDEQENDDEYVNV